MVLDTRYSLQTLSPPQCFRHIASPVLSDETLKQRLVEVVNMMKPHGLAHLVIYADKEHGGNFEYLAGFIPRFEEALLVLSDQGTISYIIGNENLKLVPYARNAGLPLHSPIFSLPNQPMTHEQPLETLLASAGLIAGQKVGVVGWKLFTGNTEQRSSLFDVPAFILDAVKKAAGGQHCVVNATGIFISPEYGVRRINRADEIAFYEYGANLASTNVLNALDSIELGKSEKEIGHLLAADGQPNNVIMIAASGDRFAHANLYPSDKRICLGDKISLTVGFKGGLTSRSAYAVADETALPDAASDWLTQLATPYYHAVVTWLESLRVGITGGEMYAIVENVLPKARYHWHLNPGHLVADEEWLCSPIYPDSTIPLTSGMLLQIDIIPSLPGYGGSSIEDTVGLADITLQQQLAAQFPEVWKRMEIRKRYLKEVLNIKVSDEVILLSNTVGYLRPFLLDKTRALVRVK